MRLICFFGCEPSSNGLDFGWELQHRHRGLLWLLRKDVRAEVLFARGIPGFKPEARYSEIVAERLREAGISTERIHVCGDIASTASEIDSMEEFISRHPKFTEIEAASSWYHLPRIGVLWKTQHGRTVKARYLPIPLSGFILKRAFLELPKFLLIYTPPFLQDRLAKIAKRMSAI